MDKESLTEELKRDIEAFFTFRQSAEVSADKKAQEVNYAFYRQGFVDALRLRNCYEKGGNCIDVNR
jgi:hypothetical protein